MEFLLGIATFVLGVIAGISLNMKVEVTKIYQGKDGEE